MARVLYVATSDIHINTFHVPYLDWLTGQGHTVDLAAEKRGEYRFESVDRHVWLHFPRSIASKRHLRTYRQLKQLIETGNYDLVHCHTPVASAITRLAARRWRKNGGKVLYTAHGFHFYSGGPVLNWMTYYPAEALLSRLTDGIITINREDLGYARGALFRADSYLIPGIGVQDSKFQALDAARRSARRQSLGYTEDQLLILYIAEFIPRKNHDFLLRSFEQVAGRIEQSRLLLAGVGREMDRIHAEVKRAGLKNRVDFLGYRSDVENFAAIADIGVSTSRHEGLGLGLLEQMMCGVPVVATQDKGHREFVEDGINGYLIEQGKTEAFCEAIIRVLTDQQLREALGRAAKVTAEEFAIKESLEAMAIVYKRFLSS